MEPMLATEIFARRNYASIDALIAVGKWEEAELILAKADLAAVTWAESNHHQDVHERRTS